jgi:hypothetical protein
MRTTLFQFLSWAMLTTFIGASFSSCKKQFDEPPVSEYPVLTSNATIASVVARHTIGMPADLITDDVVLEGIVVADDRSGNFYKNVVFQDASGGVQVRLDATSYYNQYPIGRKVWLKAKNLYIGDYGGVPQIGMDASGSAIPEALVPTYLIGGDRNQTVTPNVRTIAQLGTADLNTLVRIDSVQFAPIDTNQMYGNALAGFSVNRTLTSCLGGSVLLRSSGYAEFASQRTPTGMGSITAIVGEFGGDKQLFIRELTDLSFNNSRCAVGAGGPPISVADLRALYTGSSLLPPSRTLRGIVISDRVGNNWDGRNLVIQDGQSGITLRLDANHSANMGDEVEISIGDDSMKVFNGLLQVYTSAANVNVVSFGNTVAPRVATAADVNANRDAWESTLVEIQDATLSGGTTYNGTRTITDASGTAPLYTRSAALFSGSTLPGGTLAVRGVVGDFNGTQILMRNTDDIIGGVVVVPTLETIANVRAMFTGANTTVGSVKIQGIVISDRTTGNIDTRNLVVQNQGGSGILIRFDAAHSINLGADVEINISGATLSSFNGLLQVQNLAASNAVVVGTGSITPFSTTIADVITNFDDYESTLVRISGATLSGATTTYNGSQTITDVTGNTILYTRSAATFSGTTMPTGSRTVTAIVSDFNGLQLQLRDANDVQ